MPAPTRAAVVSLPVLDLRLEPRHASELRSQLLLGETVRLLGRAKAGWIRVRNEGDGYAGWVRLWGLVPASPTRVALWRRRATGRIGAPMALVLALPERGGVYPSRGAATVSPVFFGNRLIASGRGAWVRVELPDGRRGLLPRTALAGRRPTLDVRVLSLLGTPYLWGGRSPAGYDCSAFVQQVLLEQGVRLPRDARDQCRAARRLRDPSQARLGDLAFFRRPGEPASHVGLGLGGGYFAHSRGRVHIASLDPDNPLCDKDLLPQFMGWYRPRDRAESP
jgi:gamma-D-glutamyl-L-lysine dipeptidyl-peptidase